MLEKSVQQLQLWLVRDHWTNPQDCFHHSPLAGRDVKLGQEASLIENTSSSSTFLQRKGSNEKKEIWRREAWKKRHTDMEMPPSTPPSESQTIPFACKQLSVSQTLDHFRNSWLSRLPKVSWLSPQLFIKHAWQTIDCSLHNCTYLSSPKGREDVQLPSRKWGQQALSPPQTEIQRSLSKGPTHKEL